MTLVCDFLKKQTYWNMAVHLFGNNSLGMQALFCCKVPYRKSCFCRRLSANGIIVEKLSIVIPYPGFKHSTKSTTTRCSCFFSATFSVFLK